MAAMLIAVYLNYIMPESVFLVIASLATFATVWVWIMILFSQIAFRRSLSKDQVSKLAFPLRGGVFTSVVAIIFLVFIIGLIGYFPTTRISLYAGLVWVAVLLLGYYIKVNRQKKQVVLTQQD
jgi:proline-specific permease ProY